jgi:hypothetical protein
VIAFVAASCAMQLPELQHREDLAARIGTFVLKYSDADLDALPRVSQAVQSAGPAIARWGELRSPVTIELLPSHELLEKAVDRPGYDWLRAWARYDEVFLQSPRTWGPIVPTQAEVNELLTHELTHCMMYQQSADRLGWSETYYPLWFREGMASYTADQGYRWPSLEDLARYLDAHPSEDPIDQPEALYKTESDIVYAAAHDTFMFLTQRYGEGDVRQILLAMRSGRPFPEAFANATGTAVEAFTREFRQYAQHRELRPNPASAQAQHPTLH